MNKIKKRGIIAWSVVLIMVLFFYEGKENNNVSTVKETAGNTVQKGEKNGNTGGNLKKQEDENQDETYAMIKELGFHYEETVLPLNTEDYYNDGIWETALDTDGKLIAYGRNDKTGQGNLLSWADGKQIEKRFPSGGNLPKKIKTGYIEIAPCSYENANGYVLYKRDKKQKYLCYLLDKEGEIKEQIPLQKYLDQEIKEECYVIHGIQQAGENKINVMVSGYNWTLYRQFRGDLSEWDTFYVLEIDIIKKELSFVGTYGYWVLGADENNVYGIDFSQLYSFRDFQYGVFYTQKKRTEEIIDYSNIPNDVVTPVNDCISQCFDIKNGVTYLANRTGVYRKREDKKYVWERLMKPEDSAYLNEGYTLTDLTVINDNQFYLMFLIGDDDETATVLAQYDKK